jgi:transcriptional regulator with XRE-family HTH domain
MKAPKQQYRRTYVRQWRQFRNLTLEQLSSRIGLTPSGLSMLERAERPYTQGTLERLAEALGTDPASLLMRDPSDERAIWSIWDHASPGEREQIAAVVRALKPTGTGH